MNGRVIECVPNFSEGRDATVVSAIVEAMKTVQGVSVLHVDTGAAANRTVVTFAGTPEAVAEAAFRAVGTAGRLIDMRRHHGEHPRIGATDVLPLVPVTGVTLDECAQLARQLAHRIATEWRIPCYCYEAAAFLPSHRNLADCRKGEYEGLARRLAIPDQAPDMGARPWDDDLARTGCTVVGARKFLIAVNFNLNTRDRQVAHTIACEVRQSGRAGRPGTLRCVKALGWYIEEYGVAQVSMNITDMDVTPLHRAWEEVSRVARLHGVEVTGTEIIGLVPRRALTEAGRYFAQAQAIAHNDNDQALTDLAVQTMRLDDLRPFVTTEKVLEDRLKGKVPISCSVQSTGKSG